MTRIDICVYCRLPVNDEEDHVIVNPEERWEDKRLYAHLQCQTKAASEERAFGQSGWR